nr:hypothetical protein [Tanacetum cinerariifolium]
MLLVQAQGLGQVLDEEQLAFLVDLEIPDGQAVQITIPQNATFQTDDLDAYDFDCDDISLAKAVLMANLSSYDSDVLSECSTERKYFDIQKKEVSLDNDRLLDHISCQDVMNIVMHADSILENVLHVDNKCLVNDNLKIKRLEQENDNLFELLLSQDIVYICVNSLASCNDCCEMQQGYIDEYNENLMYKAELAKKEKMVEKTIFDELVLRCLRIENHNLDLAPLAPKLLNNRDAHLDYIKHSREHADILREIVEHARALRPLDSDFDFACKIVQRFPKETALSSSTLFINIWVLSDSETIILQRLWAMETTRWEKLRFLSLGPEPQLLTPGTLSLGLVPNPPPPTPYVPSIKKDWDTLFQPMFDEYFNHSPSVASLVPAVVAPDPADSTGSPSSTPDNQDAPSPSNSKTPQASQSLVSSLDVVEDFYDIEVAHLDNDPFFGVLIPKPNSKESSSRDVIPTNAIRIFIAYAAYMNMIVYQMDVKNAFLNGILREEGVNIVESLKVLIWSVWVLFLDVRSGSFWLGDVDLLLVLDVEPCLHSNQDQWVLEIVELQDQKENLGNDDEEPKRKVASKRDWFTKPPQSQEPTDLDWNVGKTPHQGPTQSWLITLASGLVTGHHYLPDLTLLRLKKRKTGYFGPVVGFASLLVFLFFNPGLIWQKGLHLYLCLFIFSLMSTLYHKLSRDSYRDRGFVALVVGGGVSVDCYGGGVKDGNDCEMTVEYTSEELVITETGTIRSMVFACLVFQDGRELPLEKQFLHLNREYLKILRI